ncbi:MAG: DNA-directed RNA polymerase subunit omega [Acidobacteriaceae bacterium]|jgi:dTDP-D-glucose 4,6-dehydratase
MRSDLIFGALTHVTNRYELCQLASKATRKLHKPNTRLQDTTNEVLDRFKDTVPMDAAAETAVDSLEERRAA